MTSSIDTTKSLAMARQALDHGDWSGAYETLRAASVDPEHEEQRLELLASAAYGAGRLEDAVAAFEDLFACCSRRGDHLGAARAAIMVAMYLMMETGLMSLVRGWLARAERLLAGQDESPVHALLAMIRMYERFMTGDVTATAEWAGRAIELGTRHEVAPAVALGRVAAARVRILQGHVEEGLQALDEVAVMLTTGELDDLTTGMIWCELICAVQGLARYDRAEEWTRAMDRWRPGGAFGSMGGRCRVHRAEMLRLRGSCQEAEDEALHACEELRPWMRREFGWPLTELGTIRLRRGDLQGAEEAFLAAHGHAWEPQPGLALLRLAQGDVGVAGALIRDALEHPAEIPSKERPPFGELRRAPLLDAQVEIAIAAGDVDVARRAASELAAIATAFPGAALAATAALAHGRVALAARDAAAAVRHCEAAVAGWAEIGAPYETAVARMALGDAHQMSGNAECARLEWDAAGAAFERLGAAPRGSGLAAASPVSPAAGSARKGHVFRCDGDTRTVTFDGSTVLLGDLKGFRYLERLLASPGREFHVLDLVAVEQGSLPAPPRHGEDLDRPGDAGPLLDDRAREAYRRRLAEIDEDIDEAGRMNDPERVARAQRDRDYLVRELARAVGLAGRSRRAGSTSERARSSVTRTLRYALDRIAEHHAALGEHLDHTVRTGTYCAYEPDPRVPIVWET